MNTRRLSAIAMLLALGAIPLVAQQQEQSHGMMGGHGAQQTCPMMGGQGSMMGGGGMMGGHGMMGSRTSMMGSGMGGMMQGMGVGASALLGAADELELTDDQVQRLEDLKDSAMQERQGHMMAAMAAHKEASEAMAGDAPDLDAYETALKEAAHHMVQGHLSTARSGQEALGVLTAEQREQLDEGMSLMSSMMCPMMGGEGMMGG